MNTPISIPLHRFEAHYDAVVVGSGYGAGIAACRLAQAGARVCVLERGRELRPGDYPDTLPEMAHEMQLDTPERHSGSKTGLYDFRVNDEINVFVGCGLGGTSLVNANVAIEPDPRVLDDARWPAELRHDIPTRLAAGYRTAHTMLGSRPLPARYRRLPKVSAHEVSAAAMGRKFSIVDINVTFEDGVNAAGFPQKACTLCGDCVTGCNHGAKNTVLMTYLPLARRHGAHIFTEVTVRRLERVGSEWLVHFDLLEAGRERFERSTLFVRTDLVFLGAGALGSTEILLRSKEHGLPLSDRVGERFSGNGDVLGFAYNCDRPINGIGFGTKRLASQAPVGPCITGVIDNRDPNAPLERGLVLEEGAIPGGLLPILPGAFGAAAAVTGEETDFGLMHRLGEMIRKLRAYFWAPDENALDHTQTFLVMAHDDSGGAMKLADDRLRIHWPTANAQPGILQADRDQLAATRPLAGTYVRNPFWTRLLHRRLTTVHPLGGCPMADTAENGVVNHKGQVFSEAQGTAVYDTLYVSDGSVIPRSVGVNPLLTISALTERCCELLVAEHRSKWRGSVPALPAAAAARPGVRFTETMVGFFSPGVKDAPRVDDTSPATATSANYAGYWEAYDQGKRQGSDFKFVLTIIAEDASAFIADPTHPARMLGTVEASALPDGPFTVLGGSFNLFVNDPKDPRSKRMHYRMQVASKRGNSYFFEGFKDIRNDPGFDLWSDTTTLFITLYAGPSNQHPIQGQGILRIKPRDFLRQLQTMQASGRMTSAQRTRTLLAFGGLFLGSLVNTYVPLLLDQRSAKRRWLERAALGVVALAIGLLWLLPFRPNLLRDEPPIVAGTGPTLPADVQALGLFPQYLRHLDLRPGAYGIETDELHVNWLRDNVVQDHGGLAKIPFTPVDISPLSELALLRGFVNLAEIHDRTGATIGIGTQLETLALDSRPPPIGKVVNANTTWTLVFPERGILFASQKEGGADLPARTRDADEAGSPWRGRAEFNHTLGPIPSRSTTVNEAMGIVQGGIGAFASVVGVFREYNLLFEVPPSGTGAMDGATRFEISYVRPTGAPRLDALPPAPEEIQRWGLPAQSLARLDFGSGYRVRQRELHFSARDNTVYATHGRKVSGDLVPASLGERSAPALDRVQVTLVKVSDRSDTVVGLAAASRVGDWSSWTLTLPGEGTLFFGSDAPPEARADGSGRARSVLSGGTGYFANAAGYLLEGRAPDGNTTLTISIVSN